MDEKVLNVAIAAFLHDIGRIVDRETFSYLESTPAVGNDPFLQTLRSKLSEDSPVLHVAALLKFFERQEVLPKKLSKPYWKVDESLVELIVGCHVPQQPLHWIIHAASRLSLGMKACQSLTESPHNANHAGLAPIFEHLMAEELGTSAAKQPFRYIYPIDQVSPDSIFPRLINQADNVPSTQTGRYRALLDKFIAAGKELIHKDESLGLWFEHFESLVMLFASLIPAADGDILDVPLYDHLKASSALATALYLYHKATDSLDTPSIQDDGAKKFLIISGDFYGIQNFIFTSGGEVQKNRSKILRGRSFAVSLFSELAADMLCRRIGIPSICTVFNAAGRFTIIAPNIEKASRVKEEVESTINEWLIKVSHGETSIGIAALEASPEDLFAGSCADLWESLALKMEKKKYRKFDLDRYGGALEDYLDGFGAEQKLAHLVCPFCGKRPTVFEAEGTEFVGEAQSACAICRDHLFLGTYLVKKTRLAVTTHDANTEGQSPWLLEPLFGEYKVGFIGGGAKKLAQAGHLLKYWDVSVHPEGFMPKDVTARLINGYVPVCGKEDLDDPRLLAGRRSKQKEEELTDNKNIGAPKTFEHIACMALNPAENGDGVCGMDALGVLKADVDWLGLLMSCGLRDERFTLSRLMALSRQMDWYFSLYLPHLLNKEKRFNDIYTVFAGGDDLFLIGPWNRIIELAEELHQSFKEYTCGNPSIHLSAGISFHKPHTPLNKLAHQADSSLGKSKEGNKNQLTLFSETIEWQQWPELIEIKETLAAWHETGLVNNAMLYRLADFIGMAAKEKALNKDEIRLEQMECLKWRALFYYAAERNVGRGVKDKEKRQQMITEFCRAAEWLEKHGSHLKIALWDVLYNFRKGR